MPEKSNERLEHALLLHLLRHRGQQVRFEADQWTTEFGILRKFSSEDSVELKATLRALEMARWIYRRIQYVVGYSEPKLVYSLTASGHRKALELAHELGESSLEPEAKTTAGDDVLAREGELAPAAPVAPPGTPNGFSG